MEKTIAWEAIIYEVDGFQDAKNWIYRMIRAGIVKCGQCDQPATHVFWQDQAEWYCRCDGHREHGEQWTGSTHWNPQSFSMNILSQDDGEAWMKMLTPDEQKNIRIKAFDATDYYSLIQEDEHGFNISTRHYLLGHEHSNRAEWVDVFPLTNGEFAYQRSVQWGNRLHTYGIYGAWSTEALALEAAKGKAK